MPSLGSHEVEGLERWKGQQSARCRKTCGRGAKRTEILDMGCSTPKLALERRYASCPQNGRYPE